MDASLRLSDEAESSCDRGHELIVKDISAGSRHSVGEAQICSCRNHLLCGIRQQNCVALTGLQAALSRSPGPTLKGLD